MKKPTCIISSKMFPRNDATIKIDLSSHGKPEPRWKGGTVSYEGRRSTWNNGVQKVIRRGSAEEKLHKHQDCVIGDWTNQQTKMKSRCKL